MRTLRTESFPSSVDGLVPRLIHSGIEAPIQYRAGDGNTCHARNRARPHRFNDALGPDPALGEGYEKTAGDEQRQGGDNR